MNLKIESPVSISLPPHFLDGTTGAAHRAAVQSLWDGTHPLEIEIGCGKGKFLVARAGENPATFFLGVDRVGKWMKIGRTRAQKRQYENLLFVKVECRQFLGTLEPESVSIFHVYFPDPWPKRRHRKRRLVTAEFLELLSSRLKPGGLVELATDDPDYFLQMKKAVAALRWNKVRESANERFLGGENKTNYELKYVARGNPIYYLELQK